MKRTITALAAIALVLALSTGAFAARKYLITSSAQIKPGTISYANLSANAKVRLTGKRGAAGPQGPQGPKGDTGAAGAAGPAGAKGDTGSTGAAGAAGPKGDAGADGTNALAQSSGLVAWTGDPGLILYEAKDTSGTIHGSSVRLTAGQVVTSLSELVVTAGAGMTRGQYAIYDKNLNLVASTANTPAAFEVSGQWVELPLTSPYTVPTTDRYYFVDLMAATTTTPVLGLLGFNTGTEARGTLPGGALRNLAQGSGLTAFPATLVPGPTSITRAILAR